ncbi:MAG: GIY-YIG nuclease family protein [Parcubacteria group bacterium]|jgi:putative endonuclease
MFYVYVIESQKNGDLYKGFTSNINNRLREHNAGLNESTRNCRPWKLVYCEIFLDKDDAISREKYLKSGWGRGYLEKVLKNYRRNKK